MPAKYDTSVFIQKAIKIHGKRYDYKLVDYKKNILPVKIICKIHGVFLKRPDKHLLNQGCFECKKINISRKHRYNTEIFIKKSEKIHGSRYDYTKSVYNGSTEFISIICKTHGEFKQKASQHLLGQGCFKCGRKTVSNKLRYTVEDFISKANCIHNYSYDYSLLKNFNGIRDKIKIICKEHGVFVQRANNHLRKQKCPKCTILNRKIIDSNYWHYKNWEVFSKKSKNFDSFKVYVIKCWNDDEVFYKVGRTFCTLKHRFKGKREMPYNYKILDEIIFKTAKEAYCYEKKLQKEYKNRKYIPNKKFGGMYECFSYL